MAKQTLIIDDLSGDTGARTRQFSLDGAAYEIDLTDASYAELKAALKPFIRVARAMGPASSGGRRASTDPRPRTRRAGAKSGAKAPTEAAVIRAWARANGMAVTERGRVAPELKAAWAAAGSPSA